MSFFSSSQKHRFSKKKKHAEIVPKEKQKENQIANEIIVNFIVGKKINYMNPVILEAIDSIANHFQPSTKM